MAPPRGGFKLQLRRAKPPLTEFGSAQYNAREVIGSNNLSALVAFWRECGSYQPNSYKNINAIAANNKRPVILTGW